MLGQSIYKLSYFDYLNNLSDEDLMIHLRNLDKNQIVSIRSIVKHNAYTQLSLNDAMIAVSLRHNYYGIIRNINNIGLVIPAYIENINIGKFIAKYADMNFVLCQIISNSEISFTTNLYLEIPELIKRENNTSKLSEMVYRLLQNQYVIDGMLKYDVMVAEMLFVAITKANYELIGRILEIRPDFAHKEIYNKHSFLVALIRDERINPVFLQHCIKKYNLNINQPTFSKDYPIYYAAESADKDKLLALLANGANPDVISLTTNKPVIKTILQNFNIEFVKTLKRYNFNIFYHLSGFNGFKPVFSAIIVNKGDNKEYVAMDLLKDNQELEKARSLYRMHHALGNKLVYHDDSGNYAKISKDWLIWSIRKFSKRNPRDLMFIKSKLKDLVTFVRNIDDFIIENLNKKNNNYCIDIPGHALYIAVDKISCDGFHITFLDKGMLALHHEQFTDRVYLPYMEMNKANTISFLNKLKNSTKQERQLLVENAIKNETYYNDNLENFKYEPHHFPKKLLKPTCSYSNLKLVVRHYLTQEFGIDLGTNIYRYIILRTRYYEALCMDYERVSKDANIDENLIRSSAIDAVSNYESKTMPLDVSFTEKEENFRANRSRYSQSGIN